VALEALKGLKTIQQIAKEYDVHPVQVSEWKKTMQEGASLAFSGEKAAVSEQERERERTRLHSKIGELSVQVDFLKKKCRQLGLPED
jgi:transposase-like protein